MMARPLSQLLPPDLPSAGASPQFGNSSQAGGSLNGGHLNSTANLKSLLQLPVKGDQRVKDCSEMKGEEKAPASPTLSVLLLRARSQPFVCSPLECVYIVLIVTRTVSFLISMITDK